MAIEILAHRANVSGPERELENSIDACRAALQKGFGLEIDLRRDSGNRFYISHDPASRSAGSDLDSFLPLFAAHPQLAIAVNVKELGYEGALIELQKSGAFGGNDFYFDFELLEPKTPGRAQGVIAGLPGGKATRMASRLSDRNEPLAQCLAIPAAVAWADEFDSLWLTGADIRAVHDAGRRLYAISPELHGFSRDERFRRWADFKAWKIDGLCTDYALEARDFFGE